MKKISFLLAILFYLIPYSYTQEKTVSPEEFFGFVPGSDRNLFDYDQLIDYFQMLDATSNRLELRETGKSPMGKAMYVAFISSSENIKELEKLKTINKELALNHNLDPEEKKRMIKEGKVFVMATLSMHSGEVGPAQSAPLTAFDLCTTTDPVKLEWLSNVVYMVVPNHNPDGMDMVVDYYQETKGSKYEGASHPGVYHKYVGHDNNRDFVILSQEDTRVIARLYNKEWYPQVFVEKHQMGSTGTRYFVPPNHDPIAENVDEGIWNWAGIFGANLMKDMTREGLSGVSQHYLFDDYWPGSTETCIWKNVIGFLTECASAKYATPIYIEPTELSVSGKGLSEYKKSINMPFPWPGGWWTLGDIVNYETVSVESILKTASANREDILEFRNALCKKQVELGNSAPPYYYIMPLEQHDQSELVNIVNLLKEHGVEVFSLKTDLKNENVLFHKGDIVVPLAQPYRAFIKEVMEEQEFPVRHYTPGGEIIKPYDITTWSLPMHNGVKSFEINEKKEGLEASLEPVPGEFSIKTETISKGKFAILPLNLNESYKTAFLALSEDINVKRLTEEQLVNNIACPKGSFIIEYRENTRAGEILNNMTVSPVYTEKEFRSEKFSLPRIALVESWFHDMDAGWTRFVLDSYYIPFTLVRPGEIQKLDLNDFDVLIFPDEEKSILLNGKYKSGESYYMSAYDPQYTKGIEKSGLKKIMEYINNGGKVISWGQSTGLFEDLHVIGNEDNKEEVRLPFWDVSKNLQEKGLYCPGSLVRMKLDTSHPLTAGMPEECGIFYRGRPLFSTTVPGFDMDRRVIGIIPEKNILMSGYCEKEELLGNKPIMIWMSKGKGELILMGFNPQFRSSTHVSYKLLFNSIIL